MTVRRLTHPKSTVVTMPVPTRNGLVVTFGSPREVEVDEPCDDPRKNNVDLRTASGVAGRRLMRASSPPVLRVLWLEPIASKCVVLDYPVRPDKTVSCVRLPPNGGFGGSGEAVRRKMRFTNGGVFGTKR